MFLLRNQTKVLFEIIQKIQVERNRSMKKKMFFLSNFVITYFPFFRRGLILENLDILNSICVLNREVNMRKAMYNYQNK